MSRSFLMDSIINSPQPSSPPSSSPASLPSSPGSPFPYPAFSGYLFSFGLQRPTAYGDYICSPAVYPKPTDPALSMLYPPYPMYGLGPHDSKVVRPLPLTSHRKPPSSFHGRARPPAKLLSRFSDSDIPHRTPPPRLSLPGTLLLTSFLLRIYLGRLP